MATLYKEAQDKIEELRSYGYEIEVFQDMTEERKDSFWYDGEIVSATRNWVTLIFWAYWEVLIRDSFSNEIYDKDHIDENNLPFDYNTWTDAELVKMFSNNDFHYVFNNWFTIYDETNPNDDAICDTVEDFLNNLPN